ncbi:MAG TPA: cytochrome c oxidase subunit II [Solirubrobacterales bacterium]|nr:cytochrome c oxidase subunit II [Solirubrobacterales bacterium]
MQAVRSRAALVSFAATVAALAATPQIAAADLLAPDSTASDGAGSARTLYAIMAILAALIVIVVFAAIVRALRTRSTAAEAGEDARRTRGTGSVQLRVGAGLGVLAIVLFVVGIIFTGKASEVEASANQPITIKADAQQWLWRYEYPIKEPSEDGFSADQAYSYQELVVPVDTPITLDISSTDVLHSWSVPALAPTAEAVPGIQGEVNFTATETGTFEGRSTRFSGPGYPTMRTRVIVVEPDEYEAFVKERIDGIKQARAAVQDRVQSGTAPGVRFETK